MSCVFHIYGICIGPDNETLLNTLTAEVIYSPIVIATASYFLDFSFFLRVYYSCNSNFPSYDPASLGLTHPPTSHKRAQALHHHVNLAWRPCSEHLIIMDLNGECLKKTFEACDAIAHASDRFWCPNECAAFPCL